MHFHGMNLDYFRYTLKLLCFVSSISIMEKYLANYFIRHLKIDTLNQDWRDTGPRLHSFLADSLTLDKHSLRCQINEPTRLAFSNFFPTLLVYLGLLIYEIYLKCPSYLFHWHLRVVYKNCRLINGLTFYCSNVKLVKEEHFQKKNLKIDKLHIAARKCETI